MKHKNQDYLDISDEVKHALDTNSAIISLESSAITHGIPYPENIETFTKMQDTIRSHQIAPALIGFLDGKIKVGFSDDEIEMMITRRTLHKINSREIAWAVSNKCSGGTTISATTFLSGFVGIRFFISGGIGGVHIGDHLDISSDLKELATNSLMLICSGAKAILSVADTVEMLETLAIPVIGYQTNRMPGFIIRDTGIPLNNFADNPEMVIQQYKVHQDLERKSAFIVVVPPPEASAIPPDEFAKTLAIANRKAEIKGISGPELTPFLLEVINTELSGSLFPVIKALLMNNVEIGSDIVQRYFMG